MPRVRDFKLLAPILSPTRTQHLVEASEPPGRPAPADRCGDGDSESAREPQAASESDSAECWTLRLHVGFKFITGIFKLDPANFTLKFKFKLIFKLNAMTPTPSRSRSAAIPLASSS